MDDRALVAAIASGDPSGLDGAYRRYADRLLAYARTIVGDGDAAADAVHDAFVLAGQRIGQLRDPDRLGAWLYAIVRCECLRLLRARKRSTALTEAHETPADLPDPAAGVQAEQVKALVHAAAAGLNPGDREVIELSVRHGLSATHVGAVLGVSANHAHARMSRARAQLEAALGALLVARGSSGRCVALSELLHDWDGRFTALLRKRINRHLKDCIGCEGRRREWMSPAALLSMYGALPFAAVVEQLRSPVVRQGAGQPPADDGFGFDDRTGFPTTGKRGGRRTAVVVGIAVLVLLGAAPVVARQMRPVEVPVAFTSPSVPPTAAVSGAPDGAGGFGVAPTRSPSPSPPPPPPPKPPSSKPPSPKPFSVQATIATDCIGSTMQWWVKVDITATGGTLKSARLYLREHASMPSQDWPMTVNGNKATHTQSPLFIPNYQWWVRAVATNGNTFTTPVKPVSRPC